MKKIIITFFVAVLFLPLYGCIENNNQSIDNSNIKNNSYSIYSIEDLTNEIWKMANAKCEGIDIFHPSVEISEDQKTITWKIAIDDFGVAAKYVAVNNSDENMESWNTTLIADAVEMTKISKEKAKSFGFNDVDMEVQLVDSDDVDSPIIYAKNGELEYDFVKDFSERIKKTTENNSLKNNSSNVSSMTKEQTDALNQAKRYLTYSSFSYSGLIEQLEYEGYSNEAATYAVDNCDADWNEQAAKMADSYLSYSSFSKERLIEQLEYEGFTREQAEFGVSKTSYGDAFSGDSINTEQTNALNQAKRYLTYSSFSYSGLIEQLEYEGYSNEAATYAVDNCDADWNEQAAKMANSYLSYSSFSKERLIEQLEYEGFTREQAEFGVSQAGY